MKSKYIYPLAFAFTFITSCNKYDYKYFKDKIDGKKENVRAFAEIGSIDIGDAGAAEISAYDPATKKLFVVNNSAVNKIDVVDLSDPAAMSVIGSIPLEKYSGAVNSVDVKNGVLAAAIGAADKQDNGVIVIFDTDDYAELKVIPAGALPDMVAFSPDGRYILSANEGEPNGDYNNDPVGSVTIVSVDNSFAAVNVDFGAFAGQVNQLKAGGLRMFGPGASFAQDMEPEYLTISKDSKTAWVTLQENNAIAKIDIASKTVTEIFPLGFKDYSEQINAIDPSDRDEIVDFRKIPVFGMYQPDAIAVLEKNGKAFLFTANEGDVREYDAFEEAERLKDVTLDASVFGDVEFLQNEANLGRLNITTTLGKKENGEFNELYSFGARSFSVWDGSNGSLLFDSQNKLEKETIDAGFYDDGRSDDKGAEAEGLTIGEVNGDPFAFVGLERADAVAIYNISDPVHPRFIKILATGDAPEGILFISRDNSPVNVSLLVVSSENDGVIKVFAPFQ